MSGHALLDIVTESLIAFPEDAHIKVFQFLSAAGASDKEKKKVQQAWTRVAMASEAFGKKNRAIDPVQFGKDFVKELSADVKELAKLDEMHGSFSSLCAAREANERAAKKDTSSARLASLHDLKKSTGVLSSLQSMTKAGRDLSDAQATAYPARDRTGAAAGSASLAGEESVLAHRRGVRTTKFVMSGKKPPNATLLYSPLHSRELDMAEVAYGEAITRHSGSTVKPTSAPCIGVKVVSKQPRAHSRAYCTYQCLHEVLPKGSGRLRLFPLPLGIIKPADQPGPTLVFDLPACRPLLPLLGMTLSAFLRKHPAVALAWCAQIGATVRAFRNCSSGRLLRLPSLNDVFIAENGQLALGNVVFEECDEADAEGVDLSDFFFSLLTAVLSLSRTVRCQLLPSLSGYDGANQREEEPFGRALSAEEEEAQAAETARRVDATEQVLSVVEGSSLQLYFDGNCHGATVLRVGENAAAVNRASLQVHVLGEESVASVTALPGVGTAGVVVLARSAGNVMLRVVVQDRGRGRGRGGVSFLALDVRVVVVPAYPIQSPELQEVAAHLHASYVSKNNDMFLSSHAIRLLNPDTGNPDPDHMLAYDEVAVHRDWTEIRLQLDQHLSHNSGYKSRKSTHF